MLQSSGCEATRQALAIKYTHILKQWKSQTKYACVCFNSKLCSRQFRFDELWIAHTESINCNSNIALCFVASCCIMWILLSVSVTCHNIFRELFCFCFFVNSLLVLMSNSPSSDERHLKTVWRCAGSSLWKHSPVDGLLIPKHNVYNIFLLIPQSSDWLAAFHLQLLQAILFISV